MYGLLGFPLGHSFSKKWFEGKGYTFQNFEYESVQGFVEAIPSELEGFNVTIPHKENIMPLLDHIDFAALEVGAVNCVKIDPVTRELTGYNTDVVGFRESLKPLLREYHKNAVVLGSGGASKAVQQALRELGLNFEVISRQNGGYDNLDLDGVDVVVNATPLGMYPKIEGAPLVDYKSIRAHAICYDLVYNPAQTLFLERCRKQGATVISGLEMLRLQAEAALSIYQSTNLE